MATTPVPQANPRQDRREFVRQRANVRKAKILEIGALDSPTFPERDTSYLDWFSRDELLESVTTNHRSPDRFVEVDYVVKNKRFAPHIGDRFQVVIANHVIEHIADPITWLRQIRRVCPRGKLFLAVPDRGYTFDYLRPVSTVADLVRARREDLQMPSQWQLFEALFYYRPLRAPHVWGGDMSPLDQPRFSVEEALRRSTQAKKEYVDTHCHVFSAETFTALINDLSGLIGWTCVETSTVTPGSNEFYAYLEAVPRAKPTAGSETATESR